MNIKGILAAFMTGAVYTLGSIAMAHTIQQVSSKYDRAVLKQKFNNLKGKIFRRRESD